MTTTTASILSRVSSILADVGNIRWSQAELIGWLNDGQREVVLHKPTAYVKSVATATVLGTRQTLPADGIQLIDVTRNMGLLGLTPGRSISLIERNTLDALIPDWHSAKTDINAKHYVYSVMDPKTYFVYPPSLGTSQVELVYGALPANATLEGVISLDDIYQTALIDVILYRAFSKDAEYAADPARAAFHYNAFLSALGSRDKAENIANPNLVARTNYGVGMPR